MAAAVHTWDKDRVMPGAVDWPDDTWAMWFSNRLRACGYGGLFFGRAGLDTRWNARWVGARLHFGFLCLEETPEMLARLRDAPDATPRRSPFATSRIERTSLAVLTPIDRVAARVTFNRGD